MGKGRNGAKVCGYSRIMNLWFGIIFIGICAFNRPYRVLVSLSFSLLRLPESAVDPAPADRCARYHSLALRPILSSRVLCVYT